MCTLLMLFTKFYLKMLFGRVCLIRDIIILLMLFMSLVCWFDVYPIP